MSKPDGSRPKLRGARSSTPTIESSTLGGYALRVRISAPGSRLSRVATIDEEVVPDVPVSGAWLSTDPTNPAHAYQLGDTSYAVEGWNSPYGRVDCPAILVLDAKTLAPLNTEISQNTDEPIVPRALECGSNEELKTAIQFDTTAGSQPHGDDPLLAVLITSGRPFSYLVNAVDGDHPSTYIFTPNDTASDEGVKSGWYHQSGDASGGGLSGWLQREYDVADSGGRDSGSIPIVTGLGPYRFSPSASLTYATHQPGDAGTNTMTFARESADGASVLPTPVSATIPGGATDGFQLVVLDDNGQIAANQAYASSDAGALATALNTWAGSGRNATVFLQSIGRPVPSGPSWNALASAVARLNGGSSAGGHGGADALMRLVSTPPPGPSHDDPQPGTYALVSTVGPSAQPDPLGDTPTSVQASAADGATGELSGLLQMTPRGALAPTLSGPGANAKLASLKGISQGVPTATHDDPAENAVLKFIAADTDDGFGPLAANACYPGVTNLPERLLVRASYCSATVSVGHWTTWAEHLRSWADGSRPIPPAYLQANPQDTDEAVFKAVALTLAAEFDAVADVRSAFGSNGSVPNTLQQASTMLGTQALHDLPRYAPTPTSPTTSFNLWRLMLPTLTLVSEVPGAEPLAPAVDLIELGQVFLEPGDPNQPQPEGHNEPVSADQLTNKTMAQLSNARLAIGPLLDRILTDPRKLLRVSQNLTGTNQTAPFTNPSANDLYAANWVQSDIDQGTDVVKMVQGLNQGLALDWTSAYYSVWQLPTGDRHDGRNGAPQPRTPADTWQLNCNYYASNEPRQEWHVFARDPLAPGNTGQAQWPDAASYLPTDASTPTAIWTLVQNQTGADPWTSAFLTNGKHNTDRHIAPPDPALVNLLEKPLDSGGYGISPSRLFTTGVHTVHPLPPTGAGSAYVAMDCGW